MSAGAAEFSSSFERFLAETRVAGAAPADESARIVLGSSVRLVRNLAGKPFPNRARPEQRREIFQKILAAAAAVPAFRGAFVFEIENLSAAQRALLVERRFAPEHFEGESLAVVIARSRELALLVNGEEHLYVKAFARGGNGDTFSRARAAERALGAQLDFAFSEKYGFLTACPADAGTGMLVSRELHLPALAMSAQLEKIVRALEAVGISLLGNLREKRAKACVFQMVNDSSLGVSETELHELVRRWTVKVCECERAARERLFSRSRVETLDRIARAYGILRHAATLSAEESADLLSLLRLGCDAGCFSENDRARFDELLTETGRAHILCRAEFQRKTCDEKRENLLRAKLFRETLSTVRPPAPPELR